MKTSFVSVHGGHSGQFCNHASDSLEEVVQRYIALGFSWVGITEHCPLPTVELLYPDERDAGMTPQSRTEQFAAYISEGRRLQKKYGTEIELYIGMEIESCSGYQTFIPDFIKTFQPDYIVGSVHHVDDFGFDYGAEQYREAVAACGGLEGLYLRYFDLQYEMMLTLKPSVVGHFDLIRIFDADYKARIAKPEIWEKILRNLATVKELDLILDLNLRALAKGADEPYISLPILQEALALDISVVPGDDSHGIASVGNHMDAGINLLTRLGFSTDWRRPTRLS